MRGARFSETVFEGSVATTSQTSAHNSAQNSPIENARQDSGNNGNGNQAVNLEGNNRGPRPRIVQPPFNQAVNTGWPPYGLPPNFNPPIFHSNFGNNSNPAFQFGSMPNSNINIFLKLVVVAGASSPSAGVSIQTIRQLIEESHLDLVNLLTQHLTSVLNPIMADTNLKYEHLANQVERVSHLVHVDEDVENQNNTENLDETYHAQHEHVENNNVRVVQRGQNADQVLQEVRNLNGIDLI
ncbi:hypothetical protein PIB30_042268 [Stylosanthes scabra]|uniref:Uncharacterized protein n=1 Tax=Stylosanthes scabra TaxID=79078 RepID=A0ABU6TEW4_9FABA|nr:hypothetical protein [Stylosanthes scabra]